MLEGVFLEGGGVNFSTIENACICNSYYVSDILRIVDKFGVNNHQVKIEQVGTRRFLGMTKMPLLQIKKLPEVGSIGQGN